MKDIKTLNGYLAVVRQKKNQSVIVTENQEEYSNKVLRGKVVSKTAVKKDTFVYFPTYASYEVEIDGEFVLFVKSEHVIAEEYE